VEVLTRSAARYLEDCARLASLAAWGILDEAHLAWLRRTLDSTWQGLDGAQRAAVRETLREWGRHGDGG
jgi:uncharacterized protein